MTKTLSSNNKHKIARASIIALALVIAAGSLSFAFVRVGSPVAPAIEASDAPLIQAQRERGIEPSFRTDEFDDIDLAYAQAASLQPMAAAVRDPVRSATISHHLLVADRMAEAWRDVAEGGRPSVIVLVSPLHEDKGLAAVQTTRGSWQTPYGSVRANDDLVAAAARQGIAMEMPDSFEREHGIGVHMPFIARLFPGTEVLPLVARSEAGSEDAARVAAFLEHELPPGALVVSSLDFSHYIPEAEMELMDAETLAAIEKNDHDAIDGFGPEHVDSSFALSLFLKRNESAGCRRSMLWHGNSAEVTGSPYAPGTSYLHMICEEADDPIVIAMGGDVMLSRAVGTKLSQRDPAAAMAPIAPAFAGADIGFVNLESVVAIQGRCGKADQSFCFRANPETAIPALQALGLSHVSVSNNHLGDYGEAAWDESFERLVEAGIEPVGGYRNDGELVVAEVDGTTIGFLAFEGLVRPISNESILERVRLARPQVDVLLVSFHWGAEYAHDPVPSIKALARATVDAGAGIVIGHHPHVLQGIETHGDGLILFSLGNLVFDQFGFDRNEGLVVRLSIEGDERRVELVPTRIENFLPRAATPEERQATLDRLAGWSEGELQEGVRTGSFGW